MTIDTRDPIAALAALEQALGADEPLGEHVLYGLAEQGYALVSRPMIEKALLQDNGIGTVSEEAERLFAILAAIQEQAGGER